MEYAVDSGNRPTIMVTNDDGIDAPGLQGLVRVLVSANRYQVLVCAPDSYVSLSESLINICVRDKLLLRVLAFAMRTIARFNSLLVFLV